MVPTIEWMQKKFNLLNKKYFDGKIPAPRFEIGSPSGTWGYLDFRGEWNTFTRNINKVYRYTLKLNNEYSRKEKDVVNTLLHEMIHAYIYMVLRKKPRNEHAGYFSQFAERFNQMGFNISEANEIQTSDVLVRKQQQKKGGVRNKKDTQKINRIIYELNFLNQNNFFRNEDTKNTVNTLVKLLYNEIGGSGQINESTNLIKLNEQDLKMIVNDAISKIEDFYR